MAHPHRPDDLTHDDRRSRLPRLMPAEIPIPAPASVLILIEHHPEDFDRRLKGYQIAFLFGGPLYADPNPRPRPRPVIPMLGQMDHGWVLSTVGILSPECSVIGELRFESAYGWVALPIIRPGDTPAAIARVARALQILQRWVPPQGRPRGKQGTGVGTQHDDLDSFLADARRQRDQHRQLGQPFTQESLAGELGLVRSTFTRGLERCGLTWKAFVAEPTSQCAKNVGGFI